jgi:hypothetical protein
MKQDSSQIRNTREDGGCDRQLCAKRDNHGLSELWPALTVYQLMRAVAAIQV